jgi:hypothetical protein
MPLGLSQPRVNTLCLAKTGIRRDLYEGEQ